MAETVIMPKLGFDMTEGTLVRWVIQEGEPVAKAAVLAEIETDKATVEVESSYEGIVARHLIKPGDIVPVNTPIAMIVAPGEQIPQEKTPSPTPEKSPDIALTETAKREETTQIEPAGEGESLPDGVRASPLARRMAEEVGINLGQVQGSGPQGRITKRDIKKFLTAKSPTAVHTPPPAAVQMPANASVAPSASPARPALLNSPLPSTDAFQDQIIPLKRLRSAIGRRMVEAKQQIPHFYVTHEYNVQSLLELRKKTNELLPEEEKISVNDFIVKATALALRQFPNLNASLDENQVIQHGAIHIGIAVAVEGGLLTIVCRDADRKPIRQIAVEVRTMANRAREGKVRPDDIEGSTFSISNLGMYDVENFSAIINPPEAAILAVGSARMVPVVQDGQVVSGSRMKATISVDHRVSDGAEAAQFLQILANYLEQPLRLLL